MVWSRSHCSARSPTRRWRHVRPAGARPGSFFGRFRSVPSGSFANAVIVLYVVSALLGAIFYLYFRVDVRPALERDGHWHVLGLFDLKEHFVGHRVRIVARLLGLLAATACRRAYSDAHRAHRDACLHRLVELPDWSRRQQHHGFRLMTSSARVPPVRIRVRDDILGPLRDRARQGSGAVHRFSLARRRPRGHPSFARCG